MRIVFPYDGYEHIGLGYLAAVAVAAGHDVQLCQISIGDYIRGYHGIAKKTIENECAKLIACKPDVVAFSLVSPTAGSMISISRRIRHHGIATIAGGAHASAAPEQTMMSDVFDALISGEADEQFVAACEYVIQPSGITPDWLYTQGHHAGHDPELPDINKIPFPAKHLFYKPAPFLANDYLILSSRGCPYKCIFCARSGKKTISQRTPESVIEELVGALKQYSPKTVYFIDDLFGFDLQWLKAFIPEYRKRVNLPFHAITHPMHFNDEKATLFREGGCFALRIGVQTTTPQVRKRLGRPESESQVTSALMAAKKAGIRLEIDHMVDLPDERIEDVRKTINYYSEIRPDAIKVYWLMPLPGSRWFTEAQENGRLNKTLALAMSKGEGFGLHSYLFAQKKYSNRQWLGCATILTYLPFLPKWTVKVLLLLRAERYIGIPSFLIVVGFARLLHFLNGWDRVGEFQLRRIHNRIVSQFSKSKSIQ